MKRTREKRINSIYKRFPELKKEKKKRGGSDIDQMDDDEENPKKKKSASKKQKKMEHIPQPDQYGSVLDYLEAKYVKGVMLDEDGEDGGDGVDEKSEGQGSVYSKDSFLDDTDLQRDVAEQVMCSNTLTKLELEQEDGDFFVNVGNLEVENDEFGDDYDPLLDKENPKAAKKKRKKSTASATSAASKKAAAAAAACSTPPAKKKKTPKKEEPGSAKSKKSATSAASTKTKKSVEKEEKDPERAELQKAVKRTKAKVDSYYKKAVAMIKKLTPEQLPRRKTKLKVALTCPPNKKPGDDITFT